ncbi:immunity 8 family protein [Uruburuella testudinis]|uniref:Immunity 8 family protein n=1 Tax=Uruburuella testudinis TaxID=1282863 RepID=A0ABY4DUV1_9NEIS|nr:immunity 8 family protein [Uruburuella testudinis]UOO82819.1 immunity 8 family protein [Uruburuella testudinis]
MIKLTLRNINLYNENFEEFTPEIADNFHQWIDLDIGIEGEQGSSIFSVCVCSPKWIAHNCRKEGFFWSNALVMEEFNHVIIKNEINKILLYSSKETWDLSLSNLLKFFSWEFEDYHPNL